MYLVKTLSKKKKGQKMVKKRSIVDDDSEVSKANSKKAKTLPKNTKTSSNSDSPQVVSTTYHCPSQSFHYNPNIHHLPPLVNLPNPICQLNPPQSNSHVLQQLQNVSTSTSSTCGSCYQQLNSINIGDYCVQCCVPICWTCCSKELYNVYYCNNCRSFNCTQ
jgi:hypothetical protein